MAKNKQLTIEERNRIDDEAFKGGTNTGTIQVDGKRYNLTPDGKMIPADKARKRISKRKPKIK